MSDELRLWDELLTRCAAHLPAHLRKRRIRWLGQLGAAVLRTAEWGSYSQNGDRLTLEELEEYAAVRIPNADLRRLYVLSVRAALNCARREPVHFA